ncbi:MULTISPECIES: bifunctional isocitrate dehydrogenase kinase/phosphatase [Arsenophonus]|uniref:bifunctional isocitrate dehydrogenase kinase/phosphatase n=1 Tax=Arsenophonus TaxID=637 RepID=UPI0015D811A8|nr:MULTISPECIES: bifunctional isocitrate dehydrogenase kinase/phosphatase [Arsenophonus]UBX28931.1 bifunctional isocitrate dehydrogenase kinase/phosphatase [Arsenophonus apicola]
MTLSSAELIAETILQGFDAQYGRFLEVTSSAQQRFEDADWHGVQEAMKKRINLYDHHVDLVVKQLGQMNLTTEFTKPLLAEIKQFYIRLLEDYPRFEIAESFFNSVYCRLFQHCDLTPTNLFIFTSQPVNRFCDTPRPLSRCFSIHMGLKKTIENILIDIPFRIAWEDLPRDVNYIVNYLKKTFSAEQLADVKFEIANELFYRNKAAWVVGKIMIGKIVYPFLLPIHNNEQGGIYVDTCLTNYNNASIIFGFARSYFMVYVPFPAALVFWLRDILPGKSIAELYMSIGCQKHGKTEYYREYLAFINFSQEQFIIAPGIKGMVMLVFTSPSFERVFKVIKDRFLPPKQVTQERVRACYRIVKEHDRVGRMADTQEFENFVIAKKHISEELMAELWREIPSKLQDLGDKILIRHLYMERKMIPLNIYTDQVKGEELRWIIEDYGNAIKQLAAANIFPGDMLFKNFGVTRHRRVVFYDYDEICYMTEMNFRKIPEPLYPEQEMADEPWYSVAEHDVFPEEFRHFLCNDPVIKKYFEMHHADLFSTEYWQSLQNKICQGYIADVFAYPVKQRFSQRTF